LGWWCSTSSPCVDGPAQLGDGLEAAPAGAVLRLVVDDRAAAAALAAYMARSAICSSSSACPRVPRADRDAHAGGHAERHAAEVERPLDRGAQPLGQGPRAVVPQVRGQDDELVAAQAGQQVAGPQVAGQPRPHLAQQGVADGVAEGVVDLLEPVEVQDQHRGGPAGGHPRVGGAEGLEDLPAVGQAGELVGARLVPAVGQGPDLAEGERGAGEGGHHRTERQPAGQRVAVGEVARAAAGRARRRRTAPAGRAPARRAAGSDRARPGDWQAARP
jgi:hypothetical protein